MYGNTTCIRKLRVMMLFKLKYSPDNIPSCLSNKTVIFNNKHIVIITVGENK